MLLNNRFVVPGGVPVDNVINFGSLSAALTSAGLSQGDVIQIEPGSSPGNVKANDLTAPNVPNLIIQGDPAAALASIPQFTVSEATTIGASESGFTLKNVHAGLIGAGRLNFDTSTTITGSSLVDINSTAGIGILFDAGAANNIVNSITNSTLTNVGGASGVSLVRVTPSTGNGCQNVFSNDMFVASNITGSGGILLEYDSFGNAALAAFSDRVENNSFVGNAGSKVQALFRNNATATGLTVQGNTFSSPDANGIAIWLDNTGNSNNQLTNVVGNTIKLPGANSDGIKATGGLTAGAFLFAEIFNNQVSTNSAGGGTGLEIDAGTNAQTTVDVQAQGNDFHTNQIGVKVVTDIVSTSSNLIVNLGKDPVNGGLFPSSIGDNDFHGFGAASATQGPIVISGNSPVVPITITAKNNIFGSATPVDFIGVNNVTVDTSSALSGNAAFVEALYVTFLKRTTDTSPSGEAGGWVNALTKGTVTQAAVASAIMHSAEALGVVVDGLYLKLLGRPSDAGGRAAFVGYLAKGGTVEQASAIMMTSPEYVAQAGSDTAFVQSLYVKLLGRSGASADVSGWVKGLAGVGRAGVINAFLSSAEYRTAGVQQLYGFTAAPAVSEVSLFNPVLHRTAAPMTPEINSWVNSPLDLLSIETAIVGSGEFFANG